MTEAAHLFQSIRSKILSKSEHRHCSNYIFLINFSYSFISIQP